MFSVRSNTCVQNQITTQPTYCLNTKRICFCSSAICVVVQDKYANTLDPLSW